MRILFVVDSFAGGAGNVVQIVASELAKRGHSISILLLNEKQIEAKYDLNNVKVFDCSLQKDAGGISPIDRVPKAVRFLRRKFSIIKPEVIISFLTENNILCCMAKPHGTRLIVSERNDPNKEKIKKYWSLLRYFFYHRADQVVVQTSAFSNMCKSRYIDKIAVIPNPIITSPITYYPRKDIDTIKMISAGRLQPQKNFFWMIDIAKTLRNIGVDFLLDIYGKGYLYDELKKYIQINELDRYISLKGYSHNIHETLSNYDIYLMTSDYEGFPNSLSEAMAVGLPSVSRLCHDGIKDLVHNGENGYVVPMDDSQGFINAIVLLKQNYERRLTISNSAKLVSREFGAERITDLWEESIYYVLKTNTY